MASVSAVGPDLRESFQQKGELFQQPPSERGISLERWGEL